jgi:hypothetical protein
VRILTLVRYGIVTARLKLAASGHRVNVLHAVLQY